MTATSCRMPKYSCVCVQHIWHWRRRFEWRHLQHLWPSAAGLTRSIRTKHWAIILKQLSGFWIKEKNEKSVVGNQDLLVLLPFSYRTAYLSETGFSALVTTRIKLRSQMHSDHDQRWLSNTRPRSEGISKPVWHQGSQQSTNNFLFTFNAALIFVLLHNYTGPEAHPASCKMGTVSLPGAKCGWGVLLTTHPLLVPWSWKSRAIPLPTLWATPGLQRDHFTFFNFTPINKPTTSNFISFTYVIFSLASSVYSF